MRRLVFTPSQIYFSCQQGSRLENVHLNSGSTANLLGQPFPESSVGTSQDDICLRLEEYFKREISYPSDILNAFSGIARTFSRGCDPLRPNDISDHFYGIPVYQMREVDCPHEEQAKETSAVFALHLSWKVRLSETWEPIPYRHISDNAQFPTWSWASYKAALCLLSVSGATLSFQRFVSLDRIDRNLHIRLRHVTGIYRSPYEYLRSDEGYTQFHPEVEITSSTTTVRATKSISGQWYLDCNEYTISYFHDDPESLFGIDITLVHVYDKENGDEGVFLMVIPAHEDGKYRLVGHALFHRNISLTSGWSVQTLVLV